MSRPILSLGLLVWLVILLSSSHRSNATDEPDLTEIELIPIESGDEQLDDISGRWNGTVKLVSNGGGRGVSLSKFETFPGAAVALSTYVSNARNMTDGQVFEVTADQGLMIPIGGNTFGIYDGGSFDFVSVAGKEDGLGIAQTMGPCAADILRENAEDVQATFSFQTNVSLWIDVQVSFELLNTRVRNNETVLVSSSGDLDYFTYSSKNLHYNLTLIFESIDHNLNLADLLVKASIGCIEPQVINFTGVHKLTETVFLPNIMGPTYIQVESTGHGSKDVEITFIESAASGHKDDDDDKLKTWQIILIAVAGSITVAIVALIVVASVVLIVRSNRGYTTLN